MVAPSAWARIGRAAMFHLTTHAFFKALLFLGSGSVILRLPPRAGHLQDGRPGGADAAHVLDLHVAVAAIIGLPFLAGFFSKDAILWPFAYNSRAVFAVLAFTAILTAFYMLRLWKIVFLGDPRSEAAAHAHEGGSITAPAGPPGGALGPRGLPGPLSRGRSRACSRSSRGGGRDARMVVLADQPRRPGSLGAGGALAFYATDGTDALEPGPRPLRRSSPRSGPRSTAPTTGTSPRSSSAWRSCSTSSTSSAWPAWSSAASAGPWPGRLRHPGAPHGRLSNYVYWFLAASCPLGLRRRNPLMTRWHPPSIPSCFPSRPRWPSRWRSRSACPSAGR
jgi:hypothetical protein